MSAEPSSDGLSFSKFLEVSAAGRMKRAVNGKHQKAFDCVRDRAEHGVTDPEMQATLQISGDTERPRRELQDRNTLSDLLNEGFVYPWGRPEDDVPRRIHEVPVVDEPLPARYESASL